MSVTLKEKKIKTNVYLNEKNYKKLKRVSYERDIPRTVILEKALEKYIDEIDKEKKPIEIMSKEEQEELEPIFEKHRNKPFEPSERQYINPKTEEIETEYYNEDDGRWYNSKDYNSIWNDELDRFIISKKY